MVSGSLFKCCFNDSETCTTDRLNLTCDGRSYGGHCAVCTVKRFIYVVVCRPNIVSELSVTKAHFTGIFFINAETDEHRCRHSAIFHERLFVDVECLSYPSYFLVIDICLLTESVTELILYAVPLCCLMHVFTKLLNKCCDSLYHSLSYVDKARQIECRGINSIAEIVNTLFCFLSACVNSVKARLNRRHFLREGYEIFVKQLNLLCKLSDGIVIEAIGNVAEFLQAIDHRTKTARLNV